jgi:phage terminase Nu1 subunit (DNA packaging protein)
MTVAVPQAERYVDARELAALMGMSVSTIKRWTAEGMPSETWGMARTRRYLPSACISWARKRSRLDPDNPPDRRANAERANQRRR